MLNVMQTATLKIKTLPYSEMPEIPLTADIAAITKRHESIILY